MAHENSITIRKNGRWFNISTVFDGKQVSREEAVRRFNRTGSNIGGPFENQKIAVRSAKARSDSFGKNVTRRRSEAGFDAAAGNERLGVVGKATNRLVEAVGPKETRRDVRHARKAVKQGFDPARAGPAIPVTEKPRKKRGGLREVFVE